MLHRSDMEGYVRVATVEQVPVGTKINVPGIDRVDICLANVDGKYYAFSDLCTHKGEPLHRGTIKGRLVQCAAHRASFEIANGSANWPAQKSLRSYEVKIDGSAIFLKSSPRQNDLVEGGDTGDYFNGD